MSTKFVNAMTIMHNDVDVREYQIQKIKCGVTCVNSPDKLFFYMVSNSEISNMLYSSLMFNDIRQYPHALLVDVD